MRIKYTVHTKQCPYCGYTLDENWYEALAPYLGIFMIVLFPAVIAFQLIWRFGFGEPNIPKVGDKVIACPNCSLPIRTDKVAIEDLTAKELLIYRFRVWFIVSYVLGGVFAISTSILIAIALSLLETEIPNIPWYSLTSLISLACVAATIATYRVKLKGIK